MGRLMRNLTVAVLAACVAVVALAPGAALAASITVKGGGSLPVSVYTGSSYTLQVAGTAVKWYSSDKKVATVGLATGKLEALAPGKVTVTAKSKNTGKQVAAKTITVLQRAKSVTASTSELFLAVNDTATITAKLSPSTSTDVVRFYSSDKTIAKVGATSGKVTAVKNGTCTIKVISKATTKTSNTSSNNRVCEVPVHVGPYLTAAEYDGMHIFATLKGAPDTLSASDFTVINNETKATSVVKSVERNGEQIVLTLYANIWDGKTYTLYFHKTSTSFIGDEPVVDSVGLTPDTVVAGMETPVKVQLLTYKGSVIKEFGSSGSRLDVYYDVNVKLASDFGYWNGSAVCLWRPGMSATVEVIKHTWQYEDGKEVGVLSWEATVTAREPEEGEAVPSYDVRSVSYSYSGGVGGTIRLALSDNVPPGVTAEDFTVKLKPNGTSTGRAEYGPDVLIVSGKNIALVISSSDLTNGRTYEVYCTKPPIAKKLGEFTVSKYSYDWSGPSDSGSTSDGTPTKEPGNGNDNADGVLEVAA